MLEEYEVNRRWFAGDESGTDPYSKSSSRQVEQLKSGGGTVEFSILGRRRMLYTFSRFAVCCLLGCVFDFALFRPILSSFITWYYLFGSCAREREMVWSSLFPGALVCFYHPSMCLLY
jgi:hypothetical protein